jgi:hypothetical protein
MPMRPLSRNPKRIRQRGAAFVEAVGVIIAFLAVMLGASYIWGVYVEHHDLAAEARYRVWSHALDGCVSQGATTTPTRDGTIRDRASDHAETGDAHLTDTQRKLVNAGQSSTADAQGNIAHAKVSRPFQAGSFVPGMDPETIEVTRQVHCNEKIREASISSALDSIYSVVKQMNAGTPP